MAGVKELGKIRSAEFGFGGYDDAMFGLSINLGGDGWGCGDFWGAFESGEVDCNRIAELLKSARVNTVSGLVGKPIEAQFDGPNGAIKTWRILTEVL